MKKHRGLKIFGLVLAGLALFLLVINLIPPAKNVPSNPFLKEEGALPMIAAHRGGGRANPENTLLAFREAVRTIGVDVLESDLHMTKDGYLVYHHDDYVDESCNINGDLTLEQVRRLCQDENNRHYIRDLTLEQLRQYNFGYYFEDANGERIYRDVQDPASLGLQIATVEQLFEEFYQTEPELLFIVEIKDSGDRGKEACRILWEAVEKYPNYRDRIVIGTFHDEIEQELRTAYPALLRGAPTGTAAKFVITQYLRVNLFDRSSFACLQIPMSFDVGIEIDLTAKTLLERAHRRGIAVQYWTINDPDEMRFLIELGCDCIMTDDPVLLQQVLQEYR